MKNPIIIIVVLGSFFHGTQAQIEQPGRLEIELNEYEVPFKSISLDVNGVMLYREIKSESENHIQLYKVDTSLHIAWKEQIAIDFNESILWVKSHNQSLYILSRDRIQTSGDFKLTTVALENGNHTHQSIKNAIAFNPADFLVTNDGVFVSGYFNYRPLVVNFNFKNQSTRILPGFLNETGELDQMKVADDGSIDIIVSARNLEKTRCLWIRNYSPDGILNQTITLQPEKENNLIYGRSVRLDSGRQIVAGVYGRRSTVDFATGVFIAGVNPMGEYTIEYYNFGELKNFFSYMKANQRDRVKGKIERKTIQGDEVKFDYHFNIHDVIPYQDQYIIMGEAFYPHWIAPNQYGTGGRHYAGKPPTSQGYNVAPQSPVAVFDGYQYTHAVVVGFDTHGKLAWDNSFEINDAKTMELEKLVKVKTEKDRIFLLYLFANSIRSKIIHDSDVLEGKGNYPMKTNYDEKEIKSKVSETEQMDYWYGDYFYAFGIQKVRLKAVGTKRILFISKITCR